MTDETSAPETKKTISDSKLYAVARQSDLLEFLVPELATQMTVEEEITENFPRSETNKDATRILINYRNLKGKTILYQVLDHQRLDRVFDIDEFFNGYMASLEIVVEGDDPTPAIKTTVLTALNMAATTTIGVSGLDSKKVKALCETVLTSLVAILYNDSLDVIILINEQEGIDGMEQPSPVINAMWIVKQRPAASVVEETLQ